MHKMYLFRHEEIRHQRLEHFHNDAVKKLIRRDSPNMTFEEISEEETV